ncbi:hypothetical protein AVEN_111772-1 [Araneus ventricosus]|uniref:Uncharacterized protein n=1 Tax=Araneus ventricosus TaxID=182803 RepID=A0A4Y2Q900_ARAVE|nr:hypothetical protein AVEN_44526-1 [Araneus ventricosus]GBN59944.1 hypothetical protein AVEN_111772-1 [Araneus ventricosus]
MGEFVLLSHQRLILIKFWRKEGQDENVALKPPPPAPLHTRIPMDCFSWECTKHNAYSSRRSTINVLRECIKENASECQLTCLVPFAKPLVNFISSARKITVNISKTSSI